ncbi:uncharacterized protein LOC129235566 [Anastrepha obliqua]|uniref:uncharacterized protein LOC129235566 n=1 Tax=Anastrepha obliqua TaxID=95512 RepID=UPI0024095AA1|nr:uncharacterized protein LOC129235566 [Anastrepha obliqua]
MAKNKNPELERKDGENSMLQKSKKIKKVGKKSLEDKKKLQQKIIKKSVGPVKEDTGDMNGKSNVADVVLHKKSEKNKQKNGKEKERPVTEDTSDAALARIEKKKAKKLAKKLKKQQKKEAQKLEGLKKDNKILSVVEQTQEASKLKQNKEKSNDLNHKELKERDPFKEAATVFVGNLPVNTKRVQLIRLFSEYGPIDGIRFRTASGKVLYKHKDRKEAGSLNAWVVLKTVEAATRALNLNGTIFKNNHLRVTRVNVDSNSMDTKRTIFVGNLKYSANEEKLREIFSSCGDIDYVRCLHNDKGCKGVAYVCFKAPEAVGLALELNETMLDERPIHVERYSIKKLDAKKNCDGSDEVTKKPSLAGEKMKGKKPKDMKQEAPQTIKGGDTSKKTKFRGVKVDGLKKKQKKKVTSQMQKLAKKIAPKEK